VARDRVLQIARESGALSPREVADALASPVHAARHEMPRLASHLAVRGAAEGRVATTIEAPLQAALERLGAEMAASLDPRANLAVVVLRNADRTVAAHLDAVPGEARAGTLDLTRAVRSPGSAFKPFLYALAFDVGTIRPKTRIADLPRRFNGYAPENFDRGFTGEVTAAEALPLPRAPALARLGEPRADRLRLVFPPQGASLAEGGAVTLRAAGGQRPLTWLVNGAPIASPRHRRDAAWQPEGPGFYRVTVIDAEGESVAAEVRVR
jgi:penicillin-binding protein 1C